MASRNGASTISTAWRSFNLCAGQLMHVGQQPLNVMVHIIKKQSLKA